MGQVGPYVEQHGFTFPVLLAKTFFLGTIGDESGIPQNWLISPNGKWIATGFDEKDRDWVTSMLRKLEAELTSGL